MPQDTQILGPSMLCVPEEVARCALQLLIIARYSSSGTLTTCRQFDVVLLDCAVRFPHHRRVGRFSSSGIKHRGALCKLESVTSTHEARKPRETESGIPRMHAGIRAQFRAWNGLPLNTRETKVLEDLVHAELETVRRFRYRELRRISCRVAQT